MTNKKKSRRLKFPKLSKLPPKRILIPIVIFVAALVVGGVVYIVQNQNHPRRPAKTFEPRFTKAPSNPAPAPAPAPAPTPSTAEARSIWKPAPNTSWQWQLSTPVDTSVDVQMYDIDMFQNDSSVVSTLHAKGRKVICYISAGSVEDWRPDAGDFPAGVVGKDYEGWPGEKWLDIRRVDLIGPIMERRLDQCRDKGFDGVEPDSIHAYSQDTGFPLTYQDQLSYNRWFAKAAHDRGLSVGLKQDPDQAGDLVGDFDWALAEECFEFQECDKWTPFVQAGKAVFETEYALSSNQFCADANARNFNSIRKNKELDAYRETCR